MKKAALILAGGLGTRLRGVIGETPKALAKIAGRPILRYQLDRLADCGFQVCVLSVGYMAEPIEAEFGAAHREMELRFARETSPLGTGGGLKFAASFLDSGLDRFLALNGDSFLDVDYGQLLDELGPADALLTGKRLDDVSRFGSLRHCGDRVTGFFEKGATGPGWINAGVYVVRRAILNEAPQGAFSWERDFLAAGCVRLYFRFRPVDAFFMDIGTPEDFAKAQTAFSGLGRPFSSTRGAPDRLEDR